MCCSLKPLDVAFMRAIHHKVNIVPVIAKADTLTKTELAKLKHTVSLSYLIKITALVVVVVVEFAMLVVLYCFCCCRV